MRGTFNSTSLVASRAAVCCSGSGTHDILVRKGERKATGSERDKVGGMEGSGQILCGDGTRERNGAKFRSDLRQSKPARILSGIGEKISGGLNTMRHKDAPVLRDLFD